MADDARLTPIDRYEPQYDADDPRTFNGMGTDPSGEWVKFSDVADLIAAHARAVEGRPENWQPIETAPQDGREVLLRVKVRAGIPGKMLVGHYMAGGHCVDDHPPIDRGWYFWNGCMFDLAAQPTEWMPLPDDSEVGEARPHEPEPERIHYSADGEWVSVDTYDALRATLTAKDQQLQDWTEHNRGMHAANEALHQQIASLQQQEWKPIETAPEGTLLLFYDMNASELRNDYFVNWLVNHKMCANPGRSATHWMPLPTGPSHV